jgi:hypothetical protein
MHFSKSTLAEQVPPKNGNNALLGAALDYARRDPPGGCPRSSILHKDLNRTPRTLPLGPAADRILTAWRAAGRCPKHVVPLLENRRDRRRGAAFEAGCRRLTCPVCVARRRGLWLTHFWEKIAAAVEGGVALFLIRLASGRAWQSLQRTVRRHRGEFARVQTASGAVVVVTTADCAGAAVPAGVAVEALAEALEDLAVRPGGKNKPISASAGWRLHERRPRRYRRRGFAPRGGFTATMRKVAEAGMHPHRTTTDFGKRGDWTFPDDWTDEDRAAFFAELAAGPLLRCRSADSGPESRAV